MQLPLHNLPWSLWLEINGFYQSIRNFSHKGTRHISHAHIGKLQCFLFTFGWMPFWQSTKVIRWVILIWWNFLPRDNVVSSRQQLSFLFTIFRWDNQSHVIKAFHSRETAFLISKKRISYLKREREKKTPNVCIGIFYYSTMFSIMRLLILPVFIEWNSARWWEDSEKKHSA